MRGRLQRLGICATSGHEHFSGSLVVPIVDADGRGAGMYGRKITPGTAAQGARRCTCTSPARTAASSTRRPSWRAASVILCESLLDALTFWCAGLPQRDRAATASSGFTADTGAPSNATASSAC